MKAFLACAVVVAAWLTLGGSAGAARGLSVAPGGSFSGASVGRLTYSSGDLTSDCNFAIRADFDADTFEKVADSRIGEITSITITDCRSMYGVFPVSAIVLGEIPIRYSGFQGTLPNVTGIDLYFEDFRWQITAAGFLVCLYEGDIPVRLATTPDGRGHMTTGNMSIMANTMGLVSGSGCAATMRYSGAFTVAPQQTVTLVD